MRKYKIQEHEKKTLVWWKNREEKIDAKPFYQRKGGLWTDSDKAYLIDSIVNGFDIPKIYLCDFTWINNEILNPSKKMYSIIDGKQRLEAIFSFFKNEIALNNDFVYYANTKYNAGGMKYSDLQILYPEIAEKFDEYNLTVVTVVTDDVEAINELFVRLNKSKSLTGAEIRNAMKGKVPEIIRRITEHDFFKEYCNFPDSRGQDKNAAAKLLLFEYYGKPKDTKKKSLDQFIVNHENDNERLELTYRKILDNLDLLSTVFLPKDKLLKSAGLIPVYYMFLKDKNEMELSRIRQFLSDFEQYRKKSNEQDFSKFNVYNRSTNDEKSFINRIEILERRFKVFK